MSRFAGSRRKEIRIKAYTEGWYAARKERSLSSAREIVPLVLELVRPKSVIDVGCGTGEWLSVFGEHGVEDVWGVDGGYVSKEMLEIPEERFMAFDLKQPFRIDRKFDLVVSLEVAEHLPDKHAETFVETLTGLGPIVLFSAAIPFQGGKNHMNEQWPEYWSKRFYDKGYVVIDCLRRKIWCNERVQKWYAQNILVFVAWKYLENQPSLSKEYEHDTPQLSIVHPEIYLKNLKRAEDAEVHRRNQRLTRRVGILEQKLESMQTSRPGELHKAQRELQKAERQTRLMEQRLERIEASRAWKLAKMLHNVKSRVLGLGRGSSRIQDKR